MYIVQAVIKIERGQIILASGTTMETDEEHVDVSMGPLELFTAGGLFIEEADVRVDGEIWRVHKFDADPFPSRPHAHCVGGAKRFIGLKLHLGTRQLFDGPKALDRFLGKDQFDRLIAGVKRKFPQIELPIPTALANGEAPVASRRERR